MKSFLVKVECEVEIEAVDELDALEEFLATISLLDGGVDEWFNTYTAVKELKGGETIGKRSID